MEAGPEKRISDLGAVAVVVYAEDQRRVVLVWDKDKPDPVCWKFPGGRVEEKDRIKALAKGCSVEQQAARRELLEETGLDLPASSFTLVLRHQRQTHSFYIFAARVSRFGKFAERGNAGERIREFSPEQVEQMAASATFLPAHIPVKDAAFRYLGIAEEK